MCESVHLCIHPSPACVAFTLLCYIGTSYQPSDFSYMSDLSDLSTNLFYIILHKAACIHCNCSIMSNMLLAVTPSLVCSTQWTYSWYAAVGDGRQGVTRAPDPTSIPTFISLPSISHKFGRSLFQPL